MIEQTTISAHPAGDFFINKCDGSAAYSLNIEATPGARLMQPGLTVFYSSAKMREPSILAPGWKINGIPEAIEIGEARVLVDGAPAIHEKPSGDEIVTFDHNGTKIHFSKTSDKSVKTNIYLANKKEDAHGNCIIYRYDTKNRPVTISYGAAGNLFGSISFKYGEISSDYLTSITTYRDEALIRTYDFVHEGGLLSSIRISATDEEDPTKQFCRHPVQFKWGKSTADQFLLTEVTEITGLKFSNSYQSAPELYGVLSKSSITVSSLAKKQITYERIVNANDLFQSRDGSRYAKNLVIWDCAEQQGEYYKYNKADGGYSELNEEGKICNATATSRGENETAITVMNVVTGETTRHCLSSRARYTYLAHKSGTSLKQEKVEETYFEGSLLTSATTKFEYDTEGNISNIHMPRTTAVFELQKAPDGGDPYLRLPKRSSLYDTTDGKPFGPSSTLLKDDIYEYEFDKNFNVKKITHKTLIEGNSYSNCQSSELDARGYAARLVDTIGTARETLYSKDFSKFTTTVTSADGKNRKVESCESDKRYGNPTRSVSSDGNICVQKYDAFGELTEIYGFDPARPESWKQSDNESLIRLSKCETTFDKALNLFCLNNIKTMDARGGTSEIRLYLDAMNRPVIEAKQIDKNKWQISFNRYSTAVSANKVSLQYELKAAPSQISKKMGQLKPDSIRWFEKKYDKFGRLVEERMPDGSVKKNSWKRINDDQVEITTALTTKNGQLKSLSSQTVSSTGIVESQNQPDKLPTKYSYDALGRLTKKIDPIGQIYTYKRNALDTCVEEKNSITGTSSCTVDATLLISAENRNGQVLESYYDWLGRPTKLSVPDDDKNAQNYSIEYSDDPDNRSTSYKLAHPDGWQTLLRFAPSGHEIERTLVLGEGYSETVKSELQTNGQISRRIFPCGRSLQFAYNNLGLVKNISWAKTGKPVVQYDGFDPFGRPLYTHFGNGVSELRDYDMYGNLHGFAVTRSIKEPIAPYLSVGYAPDGAINSQILGRSINIGGKGPETHAFKYEKTGQLAAVLSEEKTVVSEFTYGPADNLQKIISGKDETSFLTNKTGYQVIGLGSRTGTSAAYDPHGNVKSIKTASTHQTLEFDFFGNLTHYIATDGKKSASIEFATDLLGDRFLKASPDGTVSIDVSSDYRIIRKADGTVLRTVKAAGPYGVLGEFTLKDKGKATKNLFREFTKTDFRGTQYLPEGLQGDGYCEEGDIYIHLDDLGSSLLTTDAKGRKSATLLFGMHGEIDGDSSKGVYNFTITYAGMSFDQETGLYFAGERYFSPLLKQFLSPDPERISTDPYGYPSDPVNYFDGQGACDDCAQHLSNWASGFIRNIGRKLKRTGLVLTMGMVCFLAVPICAQYHDDTVPGSAVAYGVRWGVAVGAWFGMLIGVPALIANCSRNNSPTLRSIAYCDDCRNVDNPNQVLGSCAMTWITIGASTVIGLIWLGPLLCFIGWDCSALFAGGLGAGTYGYYALRGAIASAGAGCIKTAASREICAKIKCLRTSITGRFVGSALVIATGMWAWQLVDLSYLRIFYNTDTDIIWYGKERFALSEMAMLLLMANPNLIWSLLPAIFNCKKFDAIWDCCFKKPREVFPQNYDVVAHRGLTIPICCCSSPTVPLIVGTTAPVTPSVPVNPLSLNTIHNTSLSHLSAQINQGPVSPSSNLTANTRVPFISNLNDPNTQLSPIDTNINDTKEEKEDSQDLNTYLQQVIEINFQNISEIVQTAQKNAPLSISHKTQSDNTENKTDPNDSDENDRKDSEKP